MIKNIKYLLSTAAFVAVATFNASASPDVVAKYNGKELHKSEVERKLRVFFNGSLPEGKNNFDSLSKEMRQRFVAEFVQQKILEDELSKSPIKNTDIYKQQLAEVERQIAIDIFLTHQAKKQVSNKMVNAEYSKYIKSLKDNDELKVSHIIVAEESKIRDLLNQINSKQITFEEAAKNNIDATKSKGGDIGFISKGKTVPEFEQAAYSAKKGNVVGPFKTDFGWHLLKVTDTRKQKIPKFEEIKAQLEQQLFAKAKQQYVTDVIKNSKVESFVN